MFRVLAYLVFCRISSLLVRGSGASADDQVELLVLRHRVKVLERQLGAKVRYRPADGAVLAALCRLLSRARWAAFLVKPETLLRWLEQACRRRARKWRAQRRAGRPHLTSLDCGERPIDRGRATEGACRLPQPAGCRAVRTNEA
jgi:hypothetical protein